MTARRRVSGAPPVWGVRRPGAGHGTDMTTAGETQWWYCLRHQRAESEPDCPHAERLGPYASEALATQALSGAARRTEAWDEDPRWNDER